MSGFTFKQFHVDHGQCAMKVGTDGILLGCWANVSDKRNALDIGAGSGLICLMLAQRMDKSSDVTGVEIDPQAFVQAQQNINASPWRNVTITRQDITDYYPNKQFDLVVSNPPFFERSLTSPNVERTLARHTESLSFESLCSVVNRVMTQDGEFALVLPFTEAERFILVAKRQGLYLSRQTIVRSKRDKAPLRSLMTFTFTIQEVVQSTLIIHAESGDYSDDYKTLCRDFYLKF